MTCLCWLCIPLTPVTPALFHLSATGSKQTNQGSVSIFVIDVFSQACQVNISRLEWHKTLGHKICEVTDTHKIMHKNEVSYLLSCCCTITMHTHTPHTHTHTHTHTHSQALYDLAQVCAGVTTVCGKQVNSELLGAFRALCLPTNIFKFCQSGYSQLTSRNNLSLLL